MAKLSISSELSTEHLDLLEAAGFENDRDLLSADAGAVHRELTKANEVLELAPETPSVDEIDAWIASVRKNAPGAARKKAAKVPASPSEPEAADPPPEEEAPGGEEAPEDSSGGEAESPVQRVDAPVNFEADPDVQEMLARAPVALPIPNRTLAEAGIRPSEIAVAPVLNRADSDLEVDVAVGEKRREPVGMPKRRASGLVQVADFRAGEKRGFDASRVRHIEDAAADPTPVPKVEVDERTRLIRTARETTNRGKDPQSRRFIRGVLHDRSVLVWTGCVVVLLFQISIPLALVASPLLILSDNPDGSFTWVPKWFVAFPIAVPVLGILYFSISYRVKCRVCGQRVLAPRQCLKNRKAHHIPLLGHIMALALHTITFKWFNCTFCGTSVRIKE